MNGGNAKGTSSFLGYKGLLNFRDLGVSSADNATGTSYIKQGMVFRSATLDNLDEHDVQEFIQQHSICTIIDLRTSREYRGESAIDKSFPTTVVESMRPSELLRMDTGHPELVHQEVDPTAQTILRRKYRIALTGKNFERNAVFMSCTLRQKSLLIWYLVSCQHGRAAWLVGREVLSPMGIANMYKQFLAHCKDEILETLLLFTDPDNYPIQIHCTQGKDRTGLISCMLLSMAGVPEDIIVKDYAKTQAGLAPIRDDMINDLKRVGLSEEFADAPPKNMRELLDYLNTTYGSVNQYLESIGFNASLQQRVRSIIAETK